MKMLFQIGVAVILLAGCGKQAKPTTPPLSLVEVKTLICGNYEGKYAKGIEHFKIRLDNTFSQVFMQNGVTNYANEGKWSFEKMEDRYLINFVPFMDMRDAIMEGKKPANLSMCTATFYDDESNIWFFRDIDYFISKADGELIKDLKAN